jgi:hypothetical protein
MLLGVAALIIGIALPVAAITRGGAPDGDEHPYVGLMVADDAAGNPLFRCSGALISPTVFVTAGHCTAAPAARATIWFEEDVESGIPGNGYPFGGATSFDGTTHTHPLFNPAAFFLFDLGVVVLDGPGNTGLSSYASLPTAGDIDAMGKGRRNSVLEAVGYGLQEIIQNPQNLIKLTAERVRLKADLMVVDTNGVAGIGNLPTGVEGVPTNSVIVSGDASHGGTCFGDSGGPMLIGTNTDVIGAVTSFGLNGNCAGVGGGFRIDRQFEIDWINGF